MILKLTQWHTKDRLPVWINSDCVFSITVESFVGGVSTIIKGNGCEQAVDETPDQIVEMLNKGQAR